MSSKMIQVKYTIEADIVSGFKDRCKSEGISMTSVIRQIMKTNHFDSNTRKTPHTRPMRRKAVQEITDFLRLILVLEEQYRDSIPEQFEQRIETADHACEHLSEAIVCLEEAFQ